MEVFLLQYCIASIGVLTRPNITRAVLGFLTTILTYSKSSEKKAEAVGLQLLPSFPLSLTLISHNSVQGQSKWVCLVIIALSGETDPLPHGSSIHGLFWAMHPSNCSAG